MGALESDTEGLLAQLAHICLLGGRTLAYPLLPAHQTHKPHTKVICIPASLPSPYCDDDINLQLYLSTIIISRSLSYEIYGT